MIPRYIYHSGALANNLGFYKKRYTAYKANPTVQLEAIPPSKQINAANAAAPQGGAGDHGQVGLLVRACGDDVCVVPRSSSSPIPIYTYTLRTTSKQAAVVLLLGAGAVAYIKLTAPPTSVVKVSLWLLCACLPTQSGYGALDLHKNPTDQLNTKPPPRLSP